MLKKNPQGPLVFTHFNALHLFIVLHVKRGPPAARGLGLWKQNGVWDGTDEQSISTLLLSKDRLSVVGHWHFDYLSGSHQVKSESSSDDQRHKYHLMKILHLNLKNYHPGSQNVSHQQQSFWRLLTRTITLDKQLILLDSNHLAICT